MNLFHPQIAAALVATISLAACVAPPAAPTIPVAPGPNKTLDRFDADQAACQQNAAAQLSPAVAAANNQAVGGALLGGALGAGLGAGIGVAAGNAGKGAAIGAASGGALGIVGNADGAPYPQEALQQPMRAFPSWFLRITCDRCGKDRMLNEAHMPQRDIARHADPRPPREDAARRLRR